jgi:hypothetical protein
MFNNILFYIILYYFIEFNQYGGISGLHIRKREIEETGNLITPISHSVSKISYLIFFYLIIYLFSY